MRPRVSGVSSDTHLAQIHAELASDVNMLSLASASTSFLAGGRAPVVSHNAVVKHAGISMAVAEPVSKTTEVRRRAAYK